MTDIVNNATIKVSADSSGVEAGLRPGIEAANRAGAAIRQTGERSASAARAVENSQRNIIASIQRTTMAMEAGGRTTANYYESLARQRNVDPASLAPYLNQLRAVEAAQTQATQATQAQAAAARELAQAQATKDSFLASLREQIALFGKSTEEVLRYRAAQAGASQEAAQLILQLQNMRTAQEQVEAAARAAAQAQREAAQADASRSAFLQGLRDQIALFGLSTEEVHRYRAAQLGAAADADPLIAKLRDLGLAQQQAAHGAQMEAQAQREAAQAHTSRTSFLKSLEQQAASIGKTRTEMLELQAAQLGVTTQAKPFLDQLRAQDHAFRDGGMSAAAMNAALRGVPAQMTDIIVSLQGGQAPLTVLLQQGGQLKDMFGGIVPAAKALGGAVLNLINPYTVAAGAAVTLAVAYKSGHDEAVRYSRALIMTGNFAGTTAGQMADMAANMEDINGSQATSAKALTTLASTGAIAGANLERFGTVAVDAQRVLGKSVEDTTKEFAALGKDPLTALRNMGDQYGFVTTETYLAVKAAQEQGRMIEAASIAQNAYADGVAKQKEKVLQTLGAWERGWINIKTAAGGAWDAVVQFAGGRDEGPQQQLAALEEQRKALDDRVERLKRIGKSRDGERYDPTKDRDVLAAQAQVAANQRAVDSINQKAAADKNAAEEESRTTQRQAVEREYADKQKILLTRREQRDRALGAAQRRGEEVGIPQSSTDPNAITIDKQLMAIRREYNDVFVAGIEASVTALRKRGELEDVLSQRALAQVKAQRDAGEITEDEALRKTAALELAQIDATKRGLQEQLGYARAKINSEREQLDLQGQIATLSEQRVNRQNQLEDDLAAAQRNRSQASMDLYMQGVEAANSELAGIEGQVKAQRLANEEIGLSKTALADLHYERMLETAALKEQSAATIEAIEPGSALAERYRRQAEELRNLAAARREGAAKQESFETGKKALDELNQFLDPSRAQTFGEALRESFGTAGDSISKLTASLDEFGRKQAEINKHRATAEAQRGTKDFDEVKYQKTIAELNDRETKNRLAGYGAMTNAAAGFFGEQSRGYKALQTASQVFHAAELAMTLAELVPKGISAVLTQGTGDPYTAFGRMAAMAAIVTGLGVAIGGIGGKADTTAVDRQKANGTGSILGDSDAKSESIKNALGAIEDNTYQGLTINSSMLTVLRSIDSGINGVSNMLYRTSGFTTQVAGMQEGAVSRSFQSGILGEINKALSGGEWFGKALGKVGNAIFGGNVTTVDTGITFDAASLAQILASGINVGQYTDTKKDGGLFRKDKYGTTVKDLGDEIDSQFTLIFGSMYDAIVQGAGILGVGGGTFIDTLSSFKVDLGKISTKDMKPEDVQAALQNAISKAGDDMAKFAVAGLGQFQKAGEGALETLTRIAAEYQTVDVVMESFGKTFGIVGMESVGARERLIDLAGGLEEFASSAEQFLNDFYSDQERADSLRARITPTLDQYGIKTGAEDSLQQFRNVVTGLDLTTEAGARAYATLIQIAPAFKQIADVDADRAEKAGEVAAKLLDLQAEIYELTGDRAGAAAVLAQQHAVALAQLDPALRGATQRLWDLQAAASAVDQVKVDANTLLSGVDAAYAVLQRVTNRQKEALQEDIRVRTEAAGKLKSLSDALRSSLDGMRTPEQQVASQAAARAEIGAALDIARAGGILPDPEKLQRAVANIGAGPSQDSYSSYQDYQRDLFRTQGELADLAQLSDSALSIEEKALKAAQDQSKQLDAMLAREQEQIDVLKGISTVGLSIEQAIRALQSAMASAMANPVVSAGSAINNAYQQHLGRAPDAAGFEWWKNAAAGGAPIGQIVDGIANSTEADLKKLYKDVLGRDPDAEGLAFWMKAYGPTMSEAEKADWLKAAQKDAAFKLPGFAIGTNYVKADMPAMIHEGERIMPAADNRELMRRLASPSDGNSALAGEVRRLTEIVAQQQAVLDRIAESSEEHMQMYRKSTGGGGIQYVKVMA